jgi:osmotically-inducible protein OsmY
VELHSLYIRKELLQMPYPIHIIVKNMRAMLLGVVDNDGDKTLAAMKARQVPGSFEVKNELMVEKNQP